EKKIKHLLVVNESEELVGIISDRDLKKSWASPATALSAHELNYLLVKLTVETIMSKKIITIPPGTTIERAARIMQENRISALPVMEEKNLVGIITTTDVMEVLLVAIGFARESARFSVIVEDKVGTVAAVSDILKTNQVNIRSLFTWPEKNFPGVYQLVMRVAAVDGENAISALKAAGYSVLTEYAADISAYLPKD
ncbi:MAG: CBS domain-containing protein, partial [Deltaproteobacteria bacterium]|nr:CBS domain-containing protein [Deltaproteobacteria bacterium]